MSQPSFAPRGVEELRDRRHVLRRRPNILDGECAIGRFVEHLCRVRRRTWTQAPARRLQSDRGVAQFPVAQRFGDRLVDRFAVSVAINANAGAAGAAEKLIERQACRLGLDIPQRHIDRGDRAHGHRAAPPISAAIEKLPRVFDPMCVAPQETRDNVVRQIADDGHLAAVERRIAETGDAIGRFDLQRNEIAARTGDDNTRVDDAQIVRRAVLRGRRSPRGFVCIENGSIRHR